MSHIKPFQPVHPNQIPLYHIPFAFHFLNVSFVPSFRRSFGSLEKFISLCSLCWSTSNGRVCKYHLFGVKCVWRSFFFNCVRIPYFHANLQYDSFALKCKIATDFQPETTLFIVFFKVFTEHTQHIPYFCIGFFSKSLNSTEVFTSSLFTQSKCRCTSLFIIYCEHSNWSKRANGIHRAPHATICWTKKTNRCR